ncbi:DNA translocase FtsK 4TM domain-containing protein [Sorangium sp. So ce1024]|uniref:DNA translocase FtsK 4TM domain-containing protein n=1 Tax=unclassified Sorangium TaxID=2621164 RepID=UPI003F09741A
MNVPLFAPRRAQPVAGPGEPLRSGARSAARTSPAGVAAPAAPRGHSYARDATALVLLVSALYSALALASFRADPLRPELTGEDWVGPVGAALAGASVEAVGVIAWFVPLELALLAMPLLGAKRSIASLFRLSGDIVVVVVLAALAHVAFPQAVAFGAMPLGGAVGELFGEVLRALFSNIGSYIIGLTIVALILMGRATFSFIELAHRVEQLAIAIAARIAGWARALFGAWAAARDLERRAAASEQESPPIIARNSSPDAIIAALADDADDPPSDPGARSTPVEPVAAEAPTIDLWKGAPTSAAPEEPAAAPKPRRGRKAQAREPREAVIHGGEPREAVIHGGEPHEVVIHGAEPREVVIHGGEAHEVVTHAAEPHEVVTHAAEPREVVTHAAEPREVVIRGAEAREVVTHAAEPEPEEAPESDAPRKVALRAAGPREGAQRFVELTEEEEAEREEAQRAAGPRERAQRAAEPRERAQRAAGPREGAQRAAEPSRAARRRAVPLAAPRDTAALEDSDESPFAGEAHLVERVVQLDEDAAVEPTALEAADDEGAAAFAEAEALDVPTPSPILPVRELPAREPEARGAHRDLPAREPREPDARATHRDLPAREPREPDARAAHRDLPAREPREPDARATHREPPAGGPERPQAAAPRAPTIVDTSRALVSEKPAVVKVVPATGEGFRLPTTDMLDAPAGGRLQLDADQLKATAQLLEKTLADYGVNGKVEEIHPGPTVTTFEVSPAAGTKVSKVAGLADDLALGLSRKVRIVAPIPGKNRIGFEIPNEHRLPVNLRELVEDRRFVEMKAPLPCVLGRDIIGTPYFADLASMPHVIVAGATGAGKSVGLNVMLVSLLFRKTPEELRLLMIDPKVVELAPFDRIPHLLLPVVTDMKQAANALKWAVDEMERRYQLFANAGTKNITTYNAWVERVQRGEARPPKPPAKVSAIGADGLEVEVDAAKDGSDAALPEKIPFIVIVVDEFADLMMQQGKDVEASVARLAQKARAAGMHVILATQRPSVDVITGMIKANFPTRIAFRVAQKVDSRTILDEQGAEHLLGRGDMLIKMNGSNETRRVQCPFCSEEEVQKITDFLRLQGEPVYDEAILRPRDEEGEEIDTSDAETDPMYDAAVRIVADTRRCSTSWLQRKLGVGYNRAAKLVEAMEKRGLVGPANGAKDREVLIAPI